MQYHVAFCQYYIMFTLCHQTTEAKGEKESAEKYTQMNQASQDEKVDWTRMTQQWPDTPERGKIVDVR